MLLAAALAAPAVAVAVSRATGDGSLAVSGASGTIYIQGSGVIYGHVDQGTLMVLQYKPDDGVSVPAVSSSKTKFVRGSGVFTASDVRFLLPSGQYTIELIASGIDISAVGKGSIVATSLSQPDSSTSLPFASTADGTISVNGGRPLALTKGSTSQSFGGSPPSVTKASTSAASGR
ncbi:MAG TPA: hypothetical protein VMV08_11180 [Gaiellaceae bacterium]|nr:hypothetical protein [Gaiellaceae bacterium]